MSALLRILALIWGAVLTVTIGLIYLAMWAVYGHAEVVCIFDGYGILGYVGLGVILSPAVIILLASSLTAWMKRF